MPIARPTERTFICDRCSTQCSLQVTDLPPGWVWGRRGPIMGDGDIYCDGCAPIAESHAKALSEWLWQLDELTTIANREAEAKVAGWQVRHPEPVMLPFVDEMLF